MVQQLLVFTTKAKKNCALENKMILKKINGTQFKELLSFGALNLQANFEEVDSLNVFPVPDGDTGTNMLRTIKGGVDALSSSKEKSIGELGKLVTNGMLLSARGNSGVILSQIFRGICKGFENKDEVNALDLVKAYKIGVKQAYGAVVTPVEGTILTVFREAVETVAEKITSESTINDFYDVHLRAAEKALKQTPNLLPILKEAGVIDSGGAGYVYIVKGMVKYLHDEKIDAEFKESFKEENKDSQIDFSAFTSDDTLQFGYCTEFILRLQKSKVDIDTFDVNQIISDLNEKDISGDSIVALKDDDVVKVHIHTQEPGIVLHKMRKYGEFLTIKCENMALQHNEQMSEEEREETKKMEHKKYAIVAVAAGDGLVKQFEAFGVDVVVNGNQTMNPSTEDFIKAFKKIDADYIYCFPNNKNIVMAAKQAAHLYKGAKVKVVCSNSIPQCFSALSMLDLSSDDPELILGSFNEAIRNVVTVEITTATRSTKVGGVTITKGDHMGIVDGKIKFSGKQKNKIIFDTLGKINGIEDKYLLTVIYGKDATEEEKQKNIALVQQKYPNLEVVSLDGGQAVYKYLLAVE